MTSKYTQDHVKQQMEKIETVRNVCLLGSKGNGKTVIMDNLGQKEGYLQENKVGEVLFSLYRADEKEKKSNIKANMVNIVTESAYFDRTVDQKTGKNTIGKEEKNQKFLYTMFDTPGHIEYSPETQAQLRMCDGCLVSVDQTSGVSVGLEYMLQDALRERVKPTLFVNFLDKLILTLEKSPEEVYIEVSRVVENINVALHTAEKLGMKDVLMDPTRCNVVFGSSLYGWQFDLKWFQKFYQQKMKKTEDDLMKRIWGDQFYNQQKKTWTTQEVDGSVRGFCKFVMDPIIKMHKQCMYPADSDKSYQDLQKQLGITLPGNHSKLKDKELLKQVMMAWLPAHKSVYTMMQTHIPNPKEQQVYRSEHLYKGDFSGKPPVSPDDEEEDQEPKPLNEVDIEIGKQMKACDPNGPVMFFQTKMQPTGSQGRFYAVGRVYSGTISTEKMWVMGPEFDPNDPEKFQFRSESRVQSVSIQMGKDIKPMIKIPAGNCCMLGGIDACVSKAQTVTTLKTQNVFVPMKFNVSQVVRIQIKPKDQKQLPKMVEGLKRLQKSDILVTCISEPTGDHIIQGCGEEHLKTCLKDLEVEHAGIPFTQGVPTVSYKETVTTTTENPILKSGGVDQVEGKPALSKSPNKHNRLYVIQEPIEEDLCEQIETYRINAQQDVKKRQRIMIDEFGWDKTDCMKIWGFGPQDIDVGGQNILIDQTKGIQYLNEIKESVNSGLLWASKDGPLQEENLRGCRFNLMDVKLHADSIHRGMGQIQPTQRRVLFGQVLTQGQRFAEPIYKQDIQCPSDVVQGVRQQINAKRGEIQGEQDQDGKVVVTTFLPIQETIGNDPFTKVLQTKSSGKQFATYQFDHWQLIQTDPMEEGTKQHQIMLDIRTRKGLKVEIPDITDFIDRL